jgi:hypothetical protein
MLALHRRFAARGRRLVACVVLAVSLGACGSRSELGLRPLPGERMPSVPGLPSLPAAPSPLPAPPAEPSDEGLGQVELPPVVPNLAPPAGARVVVADQAAPDAYVHAPPIGAAWRMLESGEGEALASCLERGRLRVRDTAPNFETRYRLEALPAGDDAVRLIVSATVIHKRQEADRARITRDHERYRRRADAMPAACGAGYVTRIDYGGRLEKRLVIARRDLRGALPIAVPSVLEVSDAPSDVSYLDALLRATFAAMKRPPALFAAVLLRDGRPRHDVSAETFDTGVSFEDFTRYAESYRQWPAFAVDLPIQFGIAPYSAR